MRKELSSLKVHNFLTERRELINRPEKTLLNGGKRGWTAILCCRAGFSCRDDDEATKEFRTIPRKGVRWDGANRGM